MEISSAFTGITLKPFQALVDARQTMNYAAAVDDPNPCYFDDLRPDGLQAHPLQPVAITWNITGRIWEFIEADDFPLEALLTQVHHTETIVHHRPLVPGEELTVTGSIAAIEPHRAGTRVVLRYAAVDADNRPVFTEYCGALLRGVTCTGGPRQDGEIPVVPRLESKPESQPASQPKSQWTAAIDIDVLRPHIYDGCTDIVFPIHTSPKFAKEVGLPGVILQGTATLALAVSEIVNRETDRDPTRIKTVACRFTGMVRPGTRIEVHLLERRDLPQGREVFFEVRDDQGNNALSDGYVKIRDHLQKS